MSAGASRDALMNMRTDAYAIAQTLEDIGPRGGDVILIKGRNNQHLERVALILAGEDITCAADYCLRRHDCATCPLLREKI